MNILGILLRIMIFIPMDIHMNLYRKRNYKFLDYFNYKRCIEGNLSLDNF
jgi:hypothetical protein